MGSGATALVTGATGFIGSSLCRRLRTDGWTVHALARAGSDLSPLAGVLPEGSVHRLDGATGPLLSLVDRLRPDVVFHLASLFIAEHESKDVLPLVESNVAFGTQLLEAMARAGCGRLVNTGTAWQHFHDAAYEPVNLYAATKQAFEDVLAFYVEARGLRAITLALFDTYGPGDPRPKLFRILQRAAEGTERLAMSPGDQLIDLVHVDDVVAAFALAAGRLLGGGVGGHERYAVSSGSPLPLKELVARYGEALGRPLPVDFGRRPYRAREVMVPWTRGERLPGWRPAIRLEDGLRAIVAPAVGGASASGPRGAPR